MRLEIRGQSTGLCLLLLLLPATVSAKQFYPITMTITGGSLCAHRPEHRTIIIDGNAVSFQNPFEACVGQLAADGTFAMSCAGTGRGVSYKLSGKITGATITGDFDATNGMRRGTDVHCTGTFRGTRRGAAKPVTK